MLPITDKGLFKVVDASQLEMWTSQGWVLVAVLEDQSDMENFPHPVQYSGAPSFISTSNSKWHDQKVSSFLLRLDEECAIKRLHDENTSLRAQAATIPELNKKLIQLEKDLKGAFEYQEKAQEHFDALMGRFDTSEKDCRSRANDLVQYKAEVAETMKQAQAIIESRKRTSYERVAEGEFDDGVESVEERVVG
jgi:hypothetical protein